MKKIVCFLVVMVVGLHFLHGVSAEIDSLYKSVYEGTFAKDVSKAWDGKDQKSEVTFDVEERIVHVKLSMKDVPGPSLFMFANVRDSIKKLCLFFVMMEDVISDYHTLTVTVCIDSAILPSLMIY